MAEVNLSAVRKRPAGITEVRLFRLNDLTLLREFLDERFVLHVVDVSRQFCTKCSFHGISQLRFSRHSDTGLVGAHSEHNEVAICRSCIFFQDTIASLSECAGLL